MREIPEDLKQFMATDPTVAAFVEVYLRGDVNEAELWRQLAIFQTRAKLAAINHASRAIAHYGVGISVKVKLCGMHFFRTCLTHRLRAGLRSANSLTR